MTRNGERLRSRSGERTITTSGDGPMGVLSVPAPRTVRLHHRGMGRPPAARIAAR